MGIAKVINPNKIECTLSFTMALEDWKLVRKTLETNSAYSELLVIREISDLVSQIEQTYYDKVD